MKSLRLALFVVSLLLPQAAAAQLASNIVQVDMQIFAPGVSPTTGSPISTTTYPVSNFVCNQVAPVVPANVTNPTRFFFNDFTNVGRVCIGNLTSTVLPSLPNQAGYLTTVTVTDNAGQTSARSAASNPFEAQGVPSVRTGLKVL